MTIVLTGTLELRGNIHDYMGESILSSAEDVDVPILSPFRLLLAMGASDVSGMLGMETSDTSISMAISNGYITKTANSEETDSECLGQILLHERLLAIDRLEEAATIVDNTGNQLARVIFENKFMGARDTIKALQHVIEKRLSDSLQLTNAQYTFAHVSVYSGRLVSGPTKVMINQMLGRYLQEKLLEYSSQDIIPLLEPAMNCCLQVPEAAKERIRNLALSQRQLHAIDSVLDGSQSTKSILQLYTQGLDVMCRLLLTLFIFGMLTLVDEDGQPVSAG